MATDGETTTGPRLPRRTTWWHRSTGIAAAATLVFSACSSGSEQQPTAESVRFAGGLADLGADGLPIDGGQFGWSDGLHRVVVTTDASPLVVGSDDDGSADVPLDWPGLTDDGERSIGAPPPSLRPVFPADRLEERLVDAAPAGSFVVVDDDGLVGDPGRRYVRTLTELYPMDDLRAVAGESSTGSSDASTDEIDDRVVAAIAELPGVESAVRTAPGLIAVTLVDEAAAGGLTDVEGVVDVTVDGDVAFGTEPRQGEQWMIHNTGSGSQAGGWPGVVDADTGADAAWDVATGNGVVVAVVDSGVDTDHPDLASNLWTNTAEICGNGVDDDGNGFVDDCQGWDFGSSDADPNPDPGARMTFHGTHVAGLVAAARNGVGVAGIAPDAEIMALKVSNSSGDISTAWVAGAIQYAADNGADVVNLSLGSMPGAPRAHHGHVEAAIQYAAARGVLVVAAMGNSGVDTTNAPVWPADFSRYHSNVVAVGASTNSDTAANFSNRGAGLTVWAPGWWTLSTMPGGGHDFSSGTSMASPVTAGAAALVIESGKATSPDRIRDRLAATAAPIGPGPRLDAAAAVGADGARDIGPLMSVSMSGAESLTHEVEGSLSWTVETDDTDGIAGFELLVAARSGGVVGAVEGLDATVTAADGTTSSMRSDMYGSLGVVPVPDPNALRSGVTFSASMALPSADYGFVVRAVGADRAPLSDGYVTFVDVAPPTAEPSPSPDPGSSPTTDPAPTPTTAPPNSGGGSTTGGGGSTGDSGGTTTGGGSTTGGSVIVVGPTVPPTTISSGPVSSTPLPTVPPTDGGSSGGGGAIAPPPSGTSAPSGPGSGPSPDPNPTPTPDPGGTTGGDTTVTTTPSTSPPTTAPAVTPTGPSVPPTTTPTPDRDTSGEYELTGMSPRSSALWGGTTSVIEGRFPTNTAIWVWYGEGRSSVVRAFVMSDRQILATAPPANSPGTHDIVVKFSTDSDHELRLSNAFTYVDATTGGDSGGGTTTGGTTTGGTVIGGTTGGSTTGGSSGGTIVIAPPPNTSGPTGPIGDGGSTGGDSTTGGTSGGTTGGGSTPPPSPDDPGSSPPPPPPADGGSGGDGSSVSGEPAVRGQLGTTTLREIRSDNALYQLAVMAWPSQDCHTSCTASRL